MIVLHNHRVIALKARKVAGTSLEIALSKFASEKCIITPIAPRDEEIRKELGYRGPQNFSFTGDRLKEEVMLKELSGDVSNFKYYNHISADLIKQRLGQDIWDSYLKLSIVRNPFEFMVSFYYFNLAMKNISEEQLVFEDWFEINKDKLTINNEVYNINGENVIDVMLVYENISHDLIQLEAEKPELKGLYNVFKNINAKGNIRPVHATIDSVYSKSPRAFEAVLSAHKPDIEKYNFYIPKI